MLLCRQVIGRHVIGALVFGCPLGGMACSPADMQSEEFEEHESALIEAAGGTPRPVAVPTLVVGSVPPRSVSCPRNRYYAIMHVEREPVLRATQPINTQAISVQAAPQSVIAVVATCPIVEGYDASDLENGVCYYDAHADVSDAPTVPGALAIADCKGIVHYKGGGPPDEKLPVINNYYSELDILLMVFPAAELKVQLVRPNQSTITVVSKTTALTPYTKTLTSLANGSFIRADFVDAPSGWVGDVVQLK